MNHKYSSTILSIYHLQRNESVKIGKYSRCFEIYTLKNCKWLLMEIFVQGIMCLWFLKYGAPWMELEMDGMQGCTNKFALCVANVFFIL